MNPMKRPFQIQFAPPAGPGRWRTTGRLKWPSRNLGIAPLCEWANDEGMRIWLPAQLKELAVELADGAEDARESWLGAAERF